MAEYREQKVNEAKAFAEMLGGEAIVFDTPDGELQDNEENRLKVCDVIREVRPNIIITHFMNSMHKDHMTTHRIVNDARFFAGLPSFQRELPAFFASSSIMPRTGRTRWTTSLTSMSTFRKRLMICG